MHLTDVFGLLGGLALFLYGMKMMGDGLELAAGPKLKMLLEKLTRNRLVAVLVGLGITAIIQSSSATTVMVVGFVNSGLMDLAQAVGVIMGANIGTTVTAQIIALDIKAVAPLMAFIGVGLIFFAKKKTLQYFGQVIAGLGILFIGMNGMSTAMSPLRDVEWFRNLLISFKNPFMGVLIGALFTAIIQSSSASVGILQALASQGLIGLDGAIFVLFGQNIGTCVTALLSSVGANHTAKRAAVIHLLFNVLGTALFMAISMVTPFIPFVESMSSSAVQQIANAHTIFNIVTTLVLLPLGGFLVKLSCKLVPGEDKPFDETLPHLEYIDERILAQPSIAVEQIRKELERMYMLARKNILIALDGFIGEVNNFDLIERNEGMINFLNREITKYLVQVSALEIPVAHAAELGSFFHVTSDIERIGDHAENIAEYTVERINGSVSFSDEAILEIKDMMGLIDKMLEKSLELFDKESRDYELEAKIMSLEEATDERVLIYRRNHAKRLREGICTPEAGMLFVDLLTDLERAADHANNIAFAMQQPYGGD